MKAKLVFGVGTMCCWFAWLGAALSRPFGEEAPGGVYTPVWVVWALFCVASVLSAIAAVLLADSQQ